MRVTSKGQVTIPQPVREAAGLLPHTEIESILDESGVRIVKADQVSGKADRGRLLVVGLRGRGNHRWTTDEIMAITRGER